MEFFFGSLMGLGLIIQYFYIEYLLNQNKELIENRKALREIIKDNQKAQSEERS